MAIIRRQQQQMSPEEEAAVLEFFKTNQELDTKFQQHNASKLEAALFHMNAVVTQESLQKAFDILKKVGELRLISQEKKKFDQSVRLGGWTTQQIAAVFTFLRSMHLEHTATDPRALHNARIVLDGLAGRDFSTASMRFAIEYAQSRGTKLHWETRNEGPKKYGKHSTDEPVHFAPKESSNRGFLQGHSHSNDPRFNGQLAREEREAAKTPWEKSTEDVMAATNSVWKMQAEALKGATHVETKRVQTAAREVALRENNWRKGYEAGKAEQRRIENERARSR